VQRVEQGEIDLVDVVRAGSVLHLISMPRARPVGPIGPLSPGFGGG
jgi:hypothetical protein